MPAQPPQRVAAPPSEAELLAVDIARRALLARYPAVARQPVRTLEVRVRPEGDVLHTYARLHWTLDKKEPFQFHECEVFASLVYTPDLRRIYDISFKDNRLHPWRVFSRQVDLVSVINEELERRDTLRMASPLVGNRQSVLVPRSRRWLHHPLRGDHAWHAGAADDHVSPRWWRAESAVPVK